MNLAAITRHYGGDLTHAGTRAMIPGPGHSAADRSVSLRLTQDGRVLVSSFGRSHFGEVKDMLRDDGFIDATGQLKGTGSAGRVGYVASQAVSTCAHLVDPLWSAAVQVKHTLSETYIGRHRAIQRPVEALGGLRHGYDVPVALLKPYARLKTPALLAEVTDAEARRIGLEITHLRRDGDRHRKEDIFLPRKTIGALRLAHQVRLDPLTDELLVGEGVFSVLSASQRFAVPAWALLSLSNMRRWTPPAGIRRLVIARDNGSAAEEVAADLRRRAEDLGIRVFVEAPLASFSDFNDEDRGVPMPSVKAKGRARSGVQQKGHLDEQNSLSDPLVL